jgi:hypothetical protein
MKIALAQVRNPSAAKFFIFNSRYFWGGGFSTRLSAKLTWVRMARCHSHPDTTAENTARMAVPQKRSNLHYLTSSIPARRDRTQVFNSERFKREFVATLAELRAGDTAA